MIVTVLPAVIGSMLAVVGVFYLALALTARLGWSQANRRLLALADTVAAIGLVASVSGIVLIGLGLAVFISAR